MVGVAGMGMGMGMASLKSIQAPVCCLWLPSRLSGSLFTCVIDVSFFWIRRQITDAESMCENHIALTCWTCMFLGTAGLSGIGSKFGCLPQAHVALVRSRW